ncbi:MAG: FAD-dependent oxidoreductase [Deltaproteobacteria bacterium HGW-Deltaproteobacteria-15]|jgi:succinate dehydrogenase/fumarate reductase flavoprotein subunit|nr:MAG: FAD-dependent oxidoreductase [Deltaproteobacteria bacterium HGW-Deltaproteobacteria-15]
MEVDKTTITTDLLVAGGGIAGLMAAISAAGQGLNVLVAEKANTKRSGSGATGNDHFCCYIPEVHGNDIGPILWEDLHSLHGDFQDPSLALLFLEQTYDRVKDWDSWGISMKPRGFWDFSGHAYPGRPRIFLKYAGYNQKGVLTAQAKKRGAKISNHMVVTDVIVKDGEAIGAVAVSTASDKPVLKVIRAKSVLLATGSATRLYPTTTPGWMFNIPFCPSCTGSGRAMAYRAGAKLVNMEMPNRHAGPKFLARCGKATWIGVYKDPHGRTVGPFVTKPTRDLGDITADVWNSVFTDMFKSGKGPVYIDCTETGEEDLEYMMWGLIHEGNTGMLDYMKKEGIDVRKHRVEFRQYEPFLIGSRGIEINEKAETNVRGLYAAGDDVGNFRADLSGAATFGWIAGKSAAKRARKLKEFKKAEKSETVAAAASRYSSFLDRKDGAGWKEANLALQQVMQDYAGVDGVRSETLLNAGSTYLRRLRERALESLSVRNSHELMRALETLDLMECGEAIFRTALERKETRAMHKRSDFPFTNPLLQDKFLTVRREEGKVITEWREKK